MNEVTDKHVTIYHNVRCSKSRETLALLQARGIAPKVVPYLDEPPSPETLKRLLAQLGLSARALMRRKEAVYTELGLDDVDDEDALIHAMHAHPILIERPIVCIHDAGADRAVIGRPPENVLSIF